MTFTDTFRQIAAGSIEREEERRFDHEAVAKLKEEGFHRLRIPEEFGGLGLTLPEAFPYLIDLAAADSNIAQALRPHFLAVESLLQAEPSQHRDTWLRKIADEELFIGNALTEVGNNAGELNTTLVPDGDRLVLSGTKFYSTGSLYADWIQVHAVGAHGEDCFAFVPKEAPGVTLFDDWTGFGQQLSASGTTKFTDVEVDPLHVSQRDYTAPASFQALAQAHHLSTLTGIAKAIERDTVEYVRTRTRSYSHANAGLPREDPQVQEVIGRLSSTAYSVRRIFDGFARELDEVVSKNAGEEDFAEIDIAAYLAQLTIAPLVLEAASQLFEVGGASATVKANGLDRHWRNARVLANHNPLIYRARLAGQQALNGGHRASQYTVGSV